MVAGFLLAAYSVIGNDSVQTLGTFIASNRKFKWYYLWVFTSVILIGTLTYSWVGYGGDVSFGRLSKIPYVEVQWYHVLAPLVLVILTRIGIPVSTSLLVLSAFASSLVFEKILLKSAMGYGLAAIVAYILWFAITKIERKYFAQHDKKGDEVISVKWRIFQWCATGFLWFSWLSHDMANIMVFLPRELSPEMLLGVLSVFVIGLAYIFYQRGGKIQNIVMEKTNVSYVRSATIIDLCYAFLLIYFKELNSIPMSTTWVFIGLLSGRELAIATVQRASYKLTNVFPIVGKDMLKLLFGLVVSVAIAFFIQNIDSILPG